MSNSIAISNWEQDLITAQQTARALLKAVEDRGLIKVGATEKEITESIYQLATELFGIKKHWHRSIVRTGANSILSFKFNPPNLTVQENDLIYLDLGPVFEEFEGDIGKTYLVGHDPLKAKLVHDLEKIWREAKQYYLNRPSMTGAELWTKVQEMTENAGWSYGSSIAGHIVGAFPHSHTYGDSPEHNINELNNVPMDTPGKDGRKRHWILEVHLTDREKRFGGFFEDLLTL